MYKDKRILATVCARGGSKGVQNKNIRLLSGKPLIVYSLELLKKSKYIDEYVVSTDSDEIIKVVKDYGYKIEFKRPEELAGDKVSRIEPIRHAVNWIQEKNNLVYDIIIDLGVATPLKDENDLDSMIEIIADKNCSNILSVAIASRNPYYNMVEDYNGRITKVKDLGKITDRRDAPVVYEMNDAFNVWKNDVLFSNTPQFNTDTCIFIMARERSIDIDEELDFYIAECIIKNKLN